MLEPKTGDEVRVEEQQTAHASCFVVSPIGPYGSETRSHMDTVFHCIIEPALRDKYTVLRGDHIARPGRITDQFVEDIINHDLIVCVLTGNNPNVYYELAIAESAARPIIVLRHRGDEVPFDVKDVRFIEYDLDPRRIFDGDYIKLLKRAEIEVAAGKRDEGKVPFAPHLTPLGRSRLNFRVAERYDLLSPEVSEILAAAEARFSFCGISLRGWTANEGFVSLLYRQAKLGVDCKLLLMSGDSPVLPEMLGPGGADKMDRVKADIQGSFDVLLKEPELTKLRVKIVQRGIIYQQMAMSEKAMIWAPHLCSRQTGQSPAVRVDLGESPSRQSGLESLYNAMRDEFDHLWWVQEER